MCSPNVPERGGPLFLNDFDDESLSSKQMVGRASGLVRHAKGNGGFRTELVLNLKIDALKGRVPRGNVWR